jgi:hypothetical protein
MKHIEFRKKVEITGITSVYMVWSWKNAAYWPQILINILNYIELHKSDLKYKKSSKPEEEFTFGMRIMKIPPPLLVTS